MELPIIVTIAAVWLLALYAGCCYNMAEDVIISFNGGQKQSEGDHWQYMLGIVVLFGLAGGLAIYTYLNDNHGLNVEGAVFSAACGTVLMYAIMVLSVRKLILIRFPGTTFSSRYYFFIKDLGARKRRSERSRNWLDSLADEL